jgi:hypothetical protein
MIDPALKQRLETKLLGQIKYNEELLREGNILKSEHMTSGNYPKDKNIRLNRSERGLLYHIIKDNQNNPNARYYLDKHCIDRNDTFHPMNPRFRSVAKIHDGSGPFNPGRTGVAQDASKGILELIKSTDKYYTKK